MRSVSRRRALYVCACLLSLPLRAVAEEPAVGVIVGEPPQSPSSDSAPPPDPLFDEDFDGAYADEIGATVRDPIESVNRVTFVVNDNVDRFLITPVTSVYQFALPEPVRICIRRAFRNLRSPVYVVNNLLQFRLREAAETLGGFALNSTAGAGGLFDPGAEVGWNQHPTDFGQTLGVYGVNSGPYLVLPLLGPSTLRDGIGDVVDRAFDPLTYVLGMGDLLFIGGSSGFIAREENAEKLAALRASAVDYYAAMRSAYTQNRESRIAQIRAKHLFIGKLRPAYAAE